MTSNPSLRREPFQPWKVIERCEVFSIPGRLVVAVETVELPDGRHVDDYLQLKLADFVLIFAETESGDILCLRQYRHGARRTSLELVGGYIDPGENPITTARRELLEETGYASEEWTPLGKFVVTAVQGLGTGYVFRARVATKIQEPCSGDLEEAAIELLGREQLKAAVRAGEVIASPHLAAVALAML
jgi:ADP-ribose pyrophosphatase